MRNRGRPMQPSQAAAKFAASERHDAQQRNERKAREAANIARTLELKALRLAKEAQDRAAASADQAVPKPKTRKPRASV